MGKRLETPVKTGAYMRMDDLEQAAEELDIWTKRRDRLLVECHRLGWSISELQRATGLARDTIRDRITRPR